MQVKKLNKLLPYVAIGTVADCQSLREPVNRILVKGGLQFFQSKNLPYKGLQAIYNKLEYHNKVTGGYTFSSQDLAFYFSPILNSGGRVANANIAIKSLTEGEDWVDKIIETNSQRKSIVADSMQGLEEELKQILAQKANLVWIMGAWHQGIVGLIASKITESYKVVTCIVSVNEEGVCSASLRAPEGYHLPEAMKAASKFLKKFGGHPQAAGMTFLQLNSNKIKDILEAEIFNQSKKITSKENDNNLIKVEAKELEKSFFESIYMLEPYGQDFKFPELDITLRDYSSILLSEGKHAKVSLAQSDILFFNIDSALKTNLLESQEIRFKAKISQNIWSNKKTWQVIFEKIIDKNLN